jgi:hypothetical protein
VSVRAAAAGLALAAVLAAGCGGGAERPPPVGPAGAEAALGARLRERDLSFRWVRCVDGGRRREGAVVWRCTVNFGQPHLPAYCVLVRDGRAVTQVEDPTLRCRRVRGAP